MKQSSFRCALQWRWIAGIACGAAVSLAFAQSSSSTEKRHKKTTAAHHSTHASAEKSHSKRAEEHSTSSRERRGHHTPLRRVSMPKPTHESIRLSHAFVASATLRPMAQQLITSRSAAAYAGVTAFAAEHPGDGAAAANLALGHAYLLDKRYSDAELAFHRAAVGDAALSDYADYLGAQAAVQGNRAQDAVPLLTKFAERHPGSLFDDQAPVLLSNAYLAQNDPASALRVLQAAGTGAESSHVDYRLALAKTYQAAGNTTKAADLYRNIYLGDPLSPEAAVAKTQMLAMNTPLTAADRKRHADALFNAKQYGEAAEEYRALQKNDAELSQADRDALEIYVAVCDLRLKKLRPGEVDHLPDTGDDSAALRMYLRAELARSVGKYDEQDAIVQQLMQSYPHSRWLEEALDSGGNMYLIQHNNSRAIADYTALVEGFPQSIYAPKDHWHAAWLNYRERRYPEAARLMDEQIVRYPLGNEIPGALYWRGRLYEDVEHNFSQALNYYKALSDAYPNSYYALEGRKRIAIIGTKPAVAPAPALASVRVVDDPHLTDVLPENDPHLIKARLLANAALNEYIRPEIQLSDTSASWGALAEARIYQSFGEDARALQAMKRAHIPFFSLTVDDVPMPYWEMEFPRPYWTQLRTDAEANGLDPYLVAALIRQESEFNPGAVSPANAWGLMQLLPSTGKSLARKEGIRHFSTSQLLDPTTNLQLGTRDLKNSIDKYSGQIEYALAAYNAGDTPVHNWIALNNYKDIPEWVESIPYTETREYVQSIMRNREMYRAIYSGR
ncbi:transglycosylase SLT domain-containing protein [Granulicella sp. 5B5]|uniref:lytic transglycosylase domain-containing protein n=1 Tax=Granulicella sp. 5B5 TaxID=1617967 RepID=UPI0015F37E6E|nr:transglycosylase SLT domain-containing protein [Granulicella sp. 5B5]QMV19824.1 transglycosylase SLT domain-containing protein [Granulicella sp. 5B5]